MKKRSRSALILFLAILLFGASSAYCDQNEGQRSLRFGLQLASDAYFGLLLQISPFELSVKAQSTLFDGFLSSAKPDDVLLVGGHVAFLFGPWDNFELGIGVDARQGITLSGNTTYRQYLDAGLRLSCSYHLGERFMVSGLLFPVWVSVRETNVTDSYSLSATIPAAGVAVTVLF